MNMVLPPVILVLDVSALSAASPREWLEFSRVGTAQIPQVVSEEMRFLFDRSPDPDLERVARAFTRFYPTSGWQTTDVNGHHPALKAASGQAMTRRSRVSLAVARCAYGLSQESPGSLVVLVSSDRALLQRLYDVQATNLCGITGPALLQWSRSGQRPIAVSQKFQQMRVPGGRSPAVVSQVPQSNSSGRAVATSTPKTTVQTKTFIQQPTKIQSTVPASSGKTALTKWWVIAIVAMIGVAAIALFSSTIQPNQQHQAPHPANTQPKSTHP
jgi:hypothetical protein